MTPFTVLGGYLGAGKTTLLNRLLSAEHGLRLAVIVNDFGDVGIDADLVVGRDGDTINLANGCICCSLAEGLAVVLDGLRERAGDIDHVIVEASGVSDPARIGDYASAFGFELRGVVVLADAEQVRARARDKYVGATVLGQLRGADLVVLTKVDLVDRARLEETSAWLASVASGTPIVESAHGEVASAIVLGDLQPEPRGDVAESSHHATTTPGAAAAEWRSIAAPAPTASTRCRRADGVPREASSAATARATSPTLRASANS